MKNLGFIAFGLLFLTSCKFSGSWQIKEPLTFKAKNKDIVIHETKAYSDRGYVGVSKSKITFSIKRKPEVKFEIKIPAGTISQNDGPFEILGSDVGQIYDFIGSTRTESESIDGTCESMCEDMAGNDVSCFPPATYSCTHDTTTRYLDLKIVDPATKAEKATFRGTISSSSTTNNDSGGGYDSGFPHWNDGSNQWP